MTRLGEDDIDGVVGVGPLAARSALERARLTLERNDTFAAQGLAVVSGWKIDALDGLNPNGFGIFLRACGERMIAEADAGGDPGGVGQPRITLCANLFKESLHRPWPSQEVAIR